MTAHVHAYVRLVLCKFFWGGSAEATLTKQVVAVGRLERRPSREIHRIKILPFEPTYPSVGGWGLVRVTQ